MYSRPSIRPPLLRPSTHGLMGRGIRHSGSSDGQYNRLAYHQSFFPIAGGLLALYAWEDDVDAAEEKKSSTPGAGTSPKDPLPPATPSNEGDNSLPQLVILGSVLTLWVVFLIRRYNVSIVSPRNYFLFTPMLPGTTTGLVEHRSIIEPLRRIIEKLHHQRAHYYEASCTDIDPVNQIITCKDTSGFVGQSDTFSLKYDKLVIAIGAINNTFGTPGVYENCFFLKEIPDSVRIRERILDCFETANIPNQPFAEKKRLLSFLVVGGGPTGVEFAAELHDFLARDIPKWYPHLMNHVSVNLVQSADHILNTFDNNISEYTEKKFHRDGINVLRNTRVLKMESGTAHMKDKDTNADIALPYGITGIGPVPLLTDFCKKVKGQNNSRAIVTDEYLVMKGAPNVYAIGDCSTYLFLIEQIDQRKLLDRVVELFSEADVNKDGTLTLDELEGLVNRTIKLYPQLEEFSRRMDRIFKEYDTEGRGSLSKDQFRQLLSTADKQLKNLPSTAQVASQQGKYLAEALNSQATSPGQETQPFHYRHLGQFSYVGDYQAVGSLLGTDMTGFGTWWLWRSIYISEQVSLRNQFLISSDWIRAFRFGRDTSRF